MKKTYLSPPNFTPTMAAYSHGVKVDVGNSEMIFVTGQIAMDKDGTAVAPGDVARQTEFIFENIKKILHEGGATLDDVVKATIFAKDVSRYAEITSVRNKYFANAKPASTLVEISNTVKEDCDVEIEVIAIKAKE